AIRAARRFERAGERTLAHVSRVVAVADVGVLTAAIFISLQATTTFWLVLTLGPVLFGLASARHPEAAAPPRPVGFSRASVRRGPTAAPTARFGR
ncbi:MAG: hypothetical protein M3312_00315, partial [Actinomycetota bacterium]|nr:hypothetical protein [Actinomycetota bacterium]